MREKLQDTLHLRLESIACYINDFFGQDKSQVQPRSKEEETNSIFDEGNGKVTLQMVLTARIGGVIIAGNNLSYLPTCNFIHFS